MTCAFLKNHPFTNLKSLDIRVRDSLGKGRDFPIIEPISQGCLFMKEIRMLISPDIVAVSLHHWRRDTYEVEGTIERARATGFIFEQSPDRFCQKIRQHRDGALDLVKEDVSLVLSNSRNRCEFYLITSRASCGLMSLEVIKVSDSSRTKSNITFQ